jgi:hypothetical protein
MAVGPATKWNPAPTAAPATTAAANQAHRTCRSHRTSCLYISKSPATDLQCSLGGNKSPGTPANRGRPLVRAALTQPYVPPQCTATGGGARKPKPHVWYRAHRLVNAGSARWCLPHARNRRGRQTSRTDAGALRYAARTAGGGVGQRWWRGQCGSGSFSFSTCVIALHSKHRGTCSQWATRGGNARREANLSP